jgi:transcriptional regulator with XRE-family HTH domain
MDAGSMDAGSVIRAARRRRGLSQAQLAERAGVSQSVVSDYERGRRDPTLTTLRRLVEATGERLRVDSALPASDLPPPRDAEESGRRLVDVLLLADAYPPPPRTPLTFPRLSS